MGDCNDTSYKQDQQPTGQTVKVNQHWTHTCSELQLAKQLDSRDLNMSSNRVQLLDNCRM